MNKKWILTFLMIIVVNLIFADEGILEVRTDIPGVKVYLNGEYVGETWNFDGINVLSLTGKKSSRYALVCKYEGYQDNEQYVYIPKEGTERVVVNFLLRDTGSVIVRSRPTGATIFLNKKELTSKTDASIDSIVVGTYNIKCVFGNNRVLEEDFTLVDEDTVRVMADFFENTIEIQTRYTVSFASNPESIVYLDGKKMGTGTLTIKLAKGNYNLRFEKTGYNTLEKTIEITGEELYLYELEKTINGFLEISAPNSYIYISGEEIGYQEENVELAPGTYNVTAKREGHDDVTKVVDIVAKEKTKVKISPIPSKGEITINLVDSKDKVSVKAYTKIKGKKTKTEDKKINKSKKEKSSSGNETIDNFFENIENVNEQLELLSIKLSRIQCYLIMVVLEPELLLQKSNNKDFQKTLDFAYNHMSEENNFIVTINEEVLNKLTATSFIPLLTNVVALGKEASSIEQDINKIKDEIEDLLNTAKNIPDEAKKLSPLKVPAVLKNIARATSQLQEMAKTTGTIIDVLSSTIMLATALITNEETEISLKMLDKGDSENVLENDTKEDFKISYVDNIRFLINNELTDYRSSKPFNIYVGQYDLSIDSDRYKLVDKNPSFLLSKGKNPDLILIVDDIYWLQKNADFWRKGKWISLTSTVLFSGLGVICNILGDAAYNNYKSSTNTADVRKYRDEVESFDGLRDLSYKISIAPAVWLIISWINEAKYNKRL